jgi:hypothetical protein
MFGGALQEINSQRQTDEAMAIFTGIRRQRQFRFKPISRLCNFSFHRTSILTMSSVDADAPATSRIDI